MTIAGGFCALQVIDKTACALHVPSDEWTANLCNMRTAGPGRVIRGMRWYERIPSTSTVGLRVQCPMSEVPTLHTYLPSLPKDDGR